MDLAQRHPPGVKLNLKKVHENRIRCTPNGVCGGAKVDLSADGNFLGSSRRTMR